jgi:hypothetical protein
VLREIGIDELIDRVLEARLFRQCSDRPRMKVGRLMLEERDLRGPRHALIDPRPKKRHLFTRQFFPLLRHHDFRVQPRNHSNDMTLRTLACDCRRARIATGQEVTARFQAEVSLALAAGVALNAARLENRLNIARKIDGAVCRSRQLRNEFRRKLGRRRGHCRKSQ